MLRSTSKEARENLRIYIANHVDVDGYGVKEPETFEEYAKFVWDTWRSEKPMKYERRKSEQDVFIDWCQGLPSALDTCYYYNRSAVVDLGNILGQSTEERSKFTEDQACYKLSTMIFLELRKVAE